MTCRVSAPRWRTASGCLSRRPPTPPPNSVVTYGSNQTTRHHAEGSQSSRGDLRSGPPHREDKASTARIRPHVTTPRRHARCVVTSGPNQTAHHHTATARAVRGDQRPESDHTSPHRDGTRGLWCCRGLETGGRASADPSVTGMVLGAGCQPGTTGNSCRGLGYRRCTDPLGRGWARRVSGGCGERA
jgi:hypothetical protein